MLMINRITWGSGPILNRAARFSGHVFVSPPEQHDKIQKPDSRDAIIENRMAAYNALFKLLPQTFTLLFIPKKHLYTDGNGKSRFARTDMTQTSYHDKSGKLIRDFQLYEDWIGSDGIIPSSHLGQIAQSAVIRMLSVMMQKRHYFRQQESSLEPEKPNLTYVESKGIEDNPRQDGPEFRRLCEKYLPIMQAFPNHAEMMFVCKGAPLADYRSETTRFAQHDTLVLSYIEDGSAKRVQIILHYPKLENPEGIIDKSSLESILLNGIHVLLKELGADADVLPDPPPSVELPKKA